LASVSATSSAVTGSHSVEIQTLAQSQKLKSANFATTSTTVGSGTLTIQFGTYSGGTFTLNPDKAAQSITISPIIHHWLVSVTQSIRPMQE
jgi:flagellar hook-associated protein 2